MSAKLEVLLKSQLIQLLLAISSIYSLMSAFYLNVFYIPYGNISISISETKALDESERISEILPALNAIKFQNPEKVIFSSIVKIENSGKTFIRKEDFDVDMPLTLKLSGGIFLDFLPGTSAPEGYINYIHLLRNHNKFIIYPCVLHPADFIEFRVFILGDENTPVGINLSGRIAGVNLDNTHNTSWGMKILKIGAILSLVILTFVVSLVTFALCLRANAKRKLHKIAIKYKNNNDEFICSVMASYSGQIPRGYHYIKGILHDLYNIKERLNSEPCENIFEFKNFRLHYGIFERLEGSNVNLKTVNHWIEILWNFKSEIRDSHAALGTD